MVLVQKHLLEKKCQRLILPFVMCFHLFPNSVLSVIYLAIYMFIWCLSLGYSKTLTSVLLAENIAQERKDTLFHLTTSMQQP